MWMRRRVTLKDVAAEVGLSAQAVSMALRGLRQIPPETRERVLEAAHRLGYEADPALSALANYRTIQRRVSRKWERIVLVNDWSGPREWLKMKLNQRLRKALLEEAKLRGIALEEAWCGHRGEAVTKLFRRLHLRGVHGVIVAPPAQGEIGHALQFPRQDFQIVTFGPEHLYPNYHVVQFDHYENLRMAWARIWEGGARRIGLVMRSRVGWRTGDAFLGAYLVEQSSCGISHAEIPPFFFDAQETASIAAFSSWIETVRPDTILTVHPEIRAWVKSCRQTIPVILLITTNATETGVDACPEAAARAAIELLSLEMQRALVHGTAFPLRIHIPGRWVSGPNAPPTPSSQ